MQRIILFLITLKLRDQIILEAIEHIVVWEVAQVELLKDDEHEEVDHDVLLEEHGQDEEDLR